MITYVYNPTIVKFEKVPILTKFYNSASANVKITKIERELMITLNIVKKILWDVVKANWNYHTKCGKYYLISRASPITL
jgi:hypothetical protein